VIHVTAALVLKRRMGSHGGGRMAEIVNLRVSRKRAQRAREDAKAEANRLAHGRPAAERKRDAATRDRDARQLDGHRIEPGDRE